jgi:membrane protein DedA with SNARE-associated domain
VEDIRDFYFVLIGTFGSLVVAGIPGVPIPEFLPVMGAGGWLGSHPGIGLLGWLLLPACILGVVIADCLLYSIGRVFGARLLNYRIFARIMPADKRERIELNFHKYGMKVLLFARLLPSLPSLVSLTAGTMRVRFVQFLLADIVYAIPGISFLFLLAYWFGSQVIQLVKNADAKVHDKVHEWQPYLILAGLLAVGGFFLYHFLRRPVSTGDPKEIPIIGEQVAAKISHPDIGGFPPDPQPTPPKVSSGNGQSATPTHAVSGNPLNVPQSSPEARR